MRLDEQDVRDPTTITAVVGGLVKDLPSQARRQRETAQAQEQKSLDQLAGLPIMEESGRSDYGITINDLIDNFEQLGRKVSFTTAPTTGGRVLKTKLDGGQDFEMEFSQSSIVTARKDGPPVERKAVDLWRVSIAGKDAPKMAGHKYFTEIAKTIKEDKTRSGSGKPAH